MGTQAGTGISLPIFTQTPLSPALVSQHHTPRGQPHFSFGRSWGLPSPVDREADAERAHCRRFSVSLQNAPQLRELVLSAPLHPLLGSSAPSRVRGQGAHLLPASTGDVHGRVGELCYKLRLLLGALSPRAQGTRSLCCVPAPPVPRVTRSLRLQCDSPVGTIQWKEDAGWAPGQGWEVRRGRSLL